ncbi:MAG: AsmA family protein [Terriglobales bacterium]
MKVRNSRRAAAAIAALVLILCVYRPGVYRLRNRIAGSIGSALGRRVALENVRLHLLPRPGFGLEGLVIYDDPAFSAEPMIRAQEVSAAIRLRSLLRGRLEIATLSATEPSINLVRNSAGRWNLTSLIERNAQIPAAPTAKPASERRPAFPYLEASNARINFKLGQIKKSFALMDGDVALWQDSENSWGARIKAEPVRTDFNLTDTGLLQISALWQRSANLRTTPLHVAVQWQKGQLGQITTLLSGKDRGWRGGLSFSAELSGTPEVLRIESQAAIEDFRRYDIVDAESLRLGTSCSGQYNAVSGELADLLCESPVGGGAVRLHGEFYQVAVPTYDLSFVAENVPLASVARLLRQAKKQIPGDLTASGLLNLDFRARRSMSRPASESSPPPWAGAGQASGLRLSLPANNTGKAASGEVVFGTIPLDLMSPDGRASPGSRPGDGHRNDKDRLPIGPYLRIGPVELSMGDSAPVNASGWVSTTGYHLGLRGDMDLKDLFRLEQVLGLPITRAAADGAAKLDVSVSGPWQGFMPAVALGTAQLHNVHAEMRGLNTPIEIGSATMSLTPEAVRIQNISARTGDTHWIGGVMAPRHCAPEGCVFQFDLTADQLSTADLGAWFTPHPAKRPWYRILSSDASSSSEDPLGASAFLAFRARGNLHVGRFGLRKVSATQVASQVDVDRGKIALTAVRGQLLQGTHRGNWVLDLTGHPMRYKGAGTLQGISLESLATLMGDAWIAGTADGNFACNGSANSFRDLLTGSEGKLLFVMRNGSLSHIAIPGSSAPLPVHRFGGEMRLNRGIWELSGGRLETRDGFYQVAGNASAASGFNFVLTRADDQSWTLTGTLAKPHLAPARSREAARAEADVKAAKP